jgi:selenide,water dikinase
MKDLAKRRRVMQRSIALGHCICNPKKPCPCDVFTEHDVCQCAGESLEIPSGPVRLTALVENPGCASKIDQAALKRILSSLPAVEDENVLLGVAAGDDAGVYRLSKNVALVQTVDVFCPSVDDPYAFGQIAAANSVSDVYAMGGRPLTALSILGFPIRAVPDSVMQDILRGGLDKMKEAGVSVIGGHSINDPEIKAGFAVTGLINPARIMTNAAARPGDALVLTKPLGTGIIAFANQIGRAPSGSLAAAAESMAALNKTASELMLASGAHAATDVTGFGLMGHLAEMAASSRVDVEISLDDLPLLPGVAECLAAGIIPGAVERNKDSSAASVVPQKGVTPEMLEICFDAQTSGGLLVALPNSRAARFVSRLRESGVPSAAVIGKVKGAGTGRVFVKTRGKFPKMLAAAAASGARTSMPASDKGECCMPKSKQPCCPNAASAQTAASSAPARAGALFPEISRKFGDYARAVGTPHVLDEKTKHCLGIALSVLARCKPCAEAHISQSRADGLTQDEIDEAAWMGILFGGSPAMIFYEELRGV